MTDALIRNIQQRISEAGYSTMQAFAVESGIRIDTLMKWVQGKSRPSKKSLEKLAAVLKCTVKDLTSEDREEPSGVDKDRTIEKLKKLVELQERVIEKMERLLVYR